jgi:hypothetical protein
MLFLFLLVHFSRDLIKIRLTNIENGFFVDRFVLGFIMIRTLTVYLYGMIVTVFALYVYDKLAPVTADLLFGDYR